MYELKAIYMFMYGLYSTVYCLRLFRIFKNLFRSHDFPRKRLKPIWSGVMVCSIFLPLLQCMFGIHIHHGDWSWTSSSTWHFINTNPIQYNIRQWCSHQTYTALAEKMRWMKKLVSVLSWVVIACSVYTRAFVLSFCSFQVIFVKNWNHSNAFLFVKKSEHAIWNISIWQFVF